MNNDFRTDRIDVRNVFGRDSLSLFLRRAVDFFDSAVERGGKCVPKVQERIFVEADVDEHRLQAHLDVLDPAFVDRANNIARAATLDAVLFETSILEQRHAPLELLHADYKFVPSSA